MDYRRLKYIKNVNNLNNPENWAYNKQDSGENRLLIGDEFRLNFRTDIKTAEEVKKHTLKLPKGSLIILSQRPLKKERFVTHVVELVNESSEDKCQWESGEWGIFRWVKVHRIANFDDPASIPVYKKVMQETWVQQGTMTASLENCKRFMSQWGNIDNLRTHLKKELNTYLMK